MAKRIKTDYPGVVYIEAASTSGKPEKVFYIYYRKDGKQIEEKIGRSIRDNMTPAKANRIRTERIERRQLSNNERRAAEQAAKEAEVGRWTIFRLWIAYDEAKAGRACRKGDSTIFKRIPEELAATAAEDLTTADIERLRWRLSSTKGVRSGKPLSAQTQKHVLALIKRILRWAEEMGYCDAASRIKFKLPSVDNQVTEHMNDEQLSAYLKALDEEADQDKAAFFRIALLTGIRRTALLNVQWADVDLNNGFLTLRGATAKSEKTRVMPLSRMAIDVLKSISRGDSAYIWPGKNDGPREDFRRMGRRLRDKAGLPKDFRPMHGLRHHFASHLASSGASLYEVGTLLTHEDMSMTKRYAHLSDNALRRAVSLADDMMTPPETKVVEIGNKD